ncbi:hypothetical protein [Paraliomyxa miuraensis]|uniref:hypothetical protein n=1 Tax=Paraliomyxa miuraensis TaxID=376150 RepID=UPI00225B0499|nr:hypothetical protein [Paraliomyxa miuraensis]MCX4246762.1 hypothetical protein [Paraliomyxa miuraensis]
MKLVFEGPNTGTALVRTVSGANPPSTAPVVFEPGSSTEQLSGQPASLCNSPAAGEPLVFTLPVPSSGASTTTLTVSSSTSSGPGIRIPVTIKHGE